MMRTSYPPTQCFPFEIKVFAFFLLFTQVSTYSISSFHKKIILSELDTTSPPSFSNGTSFSNPYALKTTAAPIPVTYTNNPIILEKWLVDNTPTLSSGYCALGFDLESVPATPWFKSKVAFEGPATVQLATSTNCIVVHLTRNYGENKSPPLNIVKSMLQDKSIIKVGVGVDDDMMELYRFNNILKASSRFDLGGVAADSPYRKIGLKTLAKSVLGIHLKKSKKLALSNWSKPLTNSQLNYCARDAWAGAAILDALEQIHPETFTPSSIQQFLANERSIADIHKSAVIRKNSKLKMKSIMRQYQLYSCLLSKENIQKFDLPPLLKKDVENLKLMLKNNAPERPNVFDQEFLGFTLASK